MQNNFNIYERRYTGLFDIISNLGGTSQLIFNIFFVVNYIYHRYVIVMDTNHFFCTIANTKINGHNSDTNLNHTIVNPLSNIKVSVLENDETKKKLNRQIYNLNLNIQGSEDIKSNGNKSNSNVINKYDKNNIHSFSKFKDNISKTSIKKNNYIKDLINSDANHNEIVKYINTSNESDESNDFSNIKMRELENINKEKRLDTIELLKEKNLSSKEKNELISEYSDINSKNKNLSKLTTNKHNFPPKKNQKVHFKDDNNKNNKDIPKITIKRTKTQDLKRLPKMSNLNDEMKKTQKLNKEMVNISKHFHQEFSFFDYILRIYSKKKHNDQYKNLLSLVSFRRKILSENFIFQQHIINLLLGKKCGINPLEIRYIIK
jgi:hypothetical protein